MRKSSRSAARPNEVSGLPQVAREAEECKSFPPRSSVPSGDSSGVLRAAQQVGQAFLAVEQAQARGQVDPVPRLFELIIAQAALELALQNASGGVGADLGEGANLIDEMRAGPNAFFDGPFAAVLEENAEAAFDDFDGGFVEFAALQDFEMLARHIGEGFLRGAPPLPAAPQKEKRQEQEGQQRCHQ